MARYHLTVARLTLWKLEARLMAKLRVRAAERSRSVEEEAREILRAALERPPKRITNVADAIREIVAASGGGVELELPPRGPVSGS